MNKIWLVSLAAVFLSCQPKEETTTIWRHQKTLQLDSINPIGIAEANGNLWLSDGDHNRLVKIAPDGKILKTIDSLDRPMHIAVIDSTLFVPEYGKDAISIFGHKGRSQLLLNDSLDAPAGVSVYGSERAIADFYNNRILYTGGGDGGWISFGKEGKAEGEFYYPTDVQITQDKIWVADAYNNRVQVFDKKGKFLQMMGQDQKMNAATGIHVTEKEVFVTDFENDRVLVFDRQGNLKQEISEDIAKPTDILVMDDTLYVLNYRRGSISTFHRTKK
ncbi:MAG TPA: NHL repeat-containing protein [Pricia sp.]|nr:NHL repeat-containing protein [Pricia sp.]